MSFRPRPRVSGYCRSFHQICKKTGREPGLLILFRKKGISIVRWGCKSFLNGPCTQPAIKIEHRAGLIVSSRSPGSTEGLLTNHRAGGFIIDIKVTGSIAKPVGRQDDSGTIAGNDGPGERIW